MSGPGSFWICGQSQYKLSVLPDWTIPLQFNGTPPFQFHATVYRNGTGYCNAWTFADLTSNNYNWTVISQDNAAMNASQVVNNRTVPVFRPGDSLVFVATERSSDGGTAVGAKYSSSYNFTVINASMAIEQRPSSAERTAVSLLWKTALVAGLLSMTALSI